MANQRIRSKKFFITTINDRFPDNVQFNIITLLNSDQNLLINQYGKIFTIKDLGEFDIQRQGNVGVILFFPIDDRINDYTYAFVSFNFFQESSDNQSGNPIELGDLVKIDSIIKSTNNFSKIIQIPLEYSSAKIDIQLSLNDNYQFDQINLTHNEQDLSFINFGTISSGPLTLNSSIGLGTYYSYIENNNIFIDFIPNIPIIDVIDFNSSVVSIANTNFSTSGQQPIRNIVLESKKTSIPRSLNPIAVGVGSHGPEYQTSYYIAQCTDLTNNNTQISEIVVINDRTQSYIVEYAKLNTGGQIGTFSTLKPLDSELLFTPNKDIDVEVTIFQTKISSIVNFSESSDVIDLDNLQIISGINRSGVDGDTVTDFSLTHKGVPIFERLFNGSNSNIVDINNNTILIPGHFFVTGEKVKYVSDEFVSQSTINSIGIAQTSVPGIGITNKLPNDVYIVKVDSTKIKLARTAEDALKILPKTYDFTSTGIGNIHKIISTNQNTKSLISIDNIIQSPIVSTAKTTFVTLNIGIDDFNIGIDDETIFSVGNLIKIDSEIMRVVGISTTNFLIVRRNILGTLREEHLINSVVSQLKGNYNIVDNKIYFSSAPYGSVPQILLSDPIDEQDYSGLEITSTFDGRVFTRSGITLSNEDTYQKNYLFDDISDNFNGITKEFEITSNFDGISGISTDNSILLINNIYQSPEPTNKLLSNVNGYYKLIEEFGETKVNFVGTGISNLSDINTSFIPFGGIIVSVGSTEGFGYQPLVSAGGTAIVSIAGTISQISIGNSGSGYRSGIQTNINVGVKTYSSGIPNIEIVGVASVLNGNVVDVQILNPGFGYTFSNPPEVVFDAPLGYVNIPLIYSNESQIGLGTQASVDLIVSQDSRVLNFNINNYGYGYKKGDILTIPTNGTVGIPTSSSILFEEFKIFVEETYNMNFSGWSMGQFEVLDNLNSKFNGKNKNFQISLEGKPISISKKRGSPIELEYVLLVFINDILQIPFKNYTFTGSIIKFNSPPNGSIENPPYLGDTSKIVFYKGTADVDVEFVEVLDAPKVGDRLTIKSNTKNLTQKNRIIELISSIDSANTNKYSDIGISDNENLLRPVKWCKQTEDLYIFNKPITKDRKIYSPYINPISYLIKNINLDDTEIFVDSVKLFFDYQKENISEKNLSIIEIISNTNNIAEYEKIQNITQFEGDFGNIVGIGSTFISGNPCLVFDFFVPIDSYLRDNELNTGISTEGISGIQTGYRFVVSGTNEGNSNTSFDVNGNVIGIGTFFIDNIYECIDYYQDNTNIVGIGNTNITKVIARVDGYDGVGFGTERIYGKYSWGRISAPFRQFPKEFIINIPAISGISSYPIIRRKTPLRNDLYLP
jgi:hypothetical protein